MKLPWNILINMVDISGEMQERNSVEKIVDSNRILRLKETHIGKG